MAAIDNPKHEKFSQAMARGVSATEAYHKVYGGKLTAAATSGGRLLRIVEIQSRIAELQARAADETVLSLRESLKFLADIVRTPVGRIDADSPLAQRVEITEAGTKIWMPDKTRALELSAKLQGLLRDKVDVAHTGQVNVNVITEEQRLDLIRMRRDALTAKTVTIN